MRPWPHCAAVISYAIYTHHFTDANQPEAVRCVTLLEINVSRQMPNVSVPISVCTARARRFTGFYLSSQLSTLSSSIQDDSYLPHVLQCPRPVPSRPLLQTRATSKPATEAPLQSCSFLCHHVRRHSLHSKTKAPIYSLGTIKTIISAHPVFL